MLLSFKIAKRLHAPIFTYVYIYICADATATVRALEGESHLPVGIVMVVMLLLLLVMVVVIILVNLLLCYLGKHHSTRILAGASHQRNHVQCVNKTTR